MPTIRELRDICQVPVLNSPGENWYGKRVSRKVSIYFTWIFLKLGLTPNQVTLLHILSGVSGALLLLRDDIISIVAAVVLLQLWLIFDCSDGEVARYTKKYSDKGIYLDYLGHYLFNPFIFLPMAVIFYREYTFSWAMLLGALLLLASIFKRLVSDLEVIITARRQLEVNNQRYNFTAGQSHEGTVAAKPVAPIRRAVLFIYNTVTVMLLVSFVAILQIWNVQLFPWLFYFYSITLPPVVIMATITIYRKIGRE